MMQQTASVIMPAYNAEKYIAEAIASVQAQSFTNWQLHVADDISTDNTAQIVKDLAGKDSRIHYHLLPQKGGGAGARNYAQQQATGRYIAFLDADDVWAPEKLATQLKFMAEKDAAFSFTSYGAIDENSQPKGCGYTVPDKITYNRQLCGSAVGCSTAMYDREKCGVQLMPLVKKRQDFALWLQILRKVGVGYGLNQKLAYYRVHSESLSSNKLSAAYYTWVVIRRIEKVNIFKALYCFGMYIVRSVYKQIKYRLKQG